MHTLCAWSTSFFSARKGRHYLINDRGENRAVAYRNDDEVPNDQEGQCNWKVEDHPAVLFEGEAVQYEEIVNNPAAHCRDNHDEEAAGPQEPRYATPRNARAPRPMKRE